MLERNNETSRLYDSMISQNNNDPAVKKVFVSLEIMLRKMNQDIAGPFLPLILLHNYSFSRVQAT